MGPVPRLIVKVLKSCIFPLYSEHICYIFEILCLVCLATLWFWNQDEVELYLVDKPITKGCNMPTEIKFITELNDWF